MTSADKLGDNAAPQLKSYLDRVETLEEQKKVIADDIKDVFLEAKGNGFDVKALKAIIRERKQDKDKLAEHEAIVETYKVALGMLSDLPLGQAAMRRDGVM